METKKVIIEMPKGTDIKYEFDPEENRFVIDRHLTIPIPQNYGFIPNTLADDGDPEDIFVLSKNPIDQGKTIEVKILYKFTCNDNGDGDNKLVGVPLDELPFEGLREEINKIRHYLKNYKKGFKILNEGMVT